MVWFIKKMFIGLLSVWTMWSFGESLVSNSKVPIKYVSLNNYLCQATVTLVNVSSSETLVYLVTVSVDNCSGSCNTINDSYAWVCVSNKVKNMNVEVYNLMSGVNETRFLVQHESCDCKCVLNKSVCNSKQK